MTLKDKVRFTEDGPKLYHHSTAEGNIEVTAVSCQCMSWKSMRLPCRHILAARANAKLDMFSESLCDKRWSLPYYKSQQRVFLADDHVTTEADISVVTFSSPKKRILSQVKVYLNILHYYYFSAVREVSACFKSYHKLS